MTNSRRAAVSLILCLGVFGACSRRPAEARAAAPPADVRAALTASHSTAAPDATSAAETVTGTVLETMDAAEYTYVRVKTGSRELWAAASRFKAAVGDTVTISLDQPMEHFHSKTLNRDFDVIYFVSQVGREGDPVPMSLPAGHPAVQPPAAGVTTPIEPAANGTSVADVWKTRKALVGRKVTVRGKVVKFNGGIMGVNWIHLQDGTGTAQDGSNDITVTTDAAAAVGDVVTATGTVAVDKDLGAGYFYPVIVEHATLVQSGR